MCIHRDQRVGTRSLPTSSMRASTSTLRWFSDTVENVRATVTDLVAKSPTGSASSRNSTASG